jgi:hypothetical protein
VSGSVRPLTQPGGSRRSRARHPAAEVSENDEVVLRLEHDRGADPLAAPGKLDFGGQIS